LGERLLIVRSAAFEYAEGVPAIGVTILVLGLEHRVAIPMRPVWIIGGVRAPLAARIGLRLALGGVAAPSILVRFERLGHASAFSRAPGREVRRSTTWRCSRSRYLPGSAQQ
jgi:hypothetical protein